MSSILVSYNNGNITINGKPYVKTSTFYDVGIYDDKCELNKDDVKFTEGLKILRGLDCMKDGKTTKNNKIVANISNQIFGILYGMNESPVSFTRLNELEHKYKSCFDRKIKPDSWTKESKDSALSKPKPTRIVFKESGLDPKYYIKSPKFCGNFANEILDPFDRAAIRSGEDIVFPKDGTEIVLDQKFLEFFGFEECSVKATRRNLKNYDYNVKIDKVDITQRISNIDNFTVDWFQGNEKKNIFIQFGKNGKNPSTRIKKGLIVAKEMGDGLQVLLMFIWSLLNKGTRYSMTTSDEVVFLQCMLLNLNCFIISSFVEKGIKKRGIRYYEPREQTVDDAKYDFNEEKEQIIEENQAFIDSIAYLINNSNINIHTEAYNNSFNFNQNFYRILYEDLTAINNILKQIDINKLVTIENSEKTQNEINEKIIEIDNILENVKSNFTFHKFMRKVQDKLKITLATKYTKSNNLWSDKYTPKLLEYSKISFFEIGRKYYRFIHAKIRGGASRNIAQNEFEKLEFDDTPAMFYDKDNDVTYDLYDELHSQIREILTSINYSQYYLSIYNELLYSFYLMNGVVYDTDLRILINEIIVNDISIPPMETSRPVSSMLPIPIQTGKRIHEMDEGLTTSKHSRIIYGNGKNRRKTRHKRIKPRFTMKKRK